MKYQGDSWEKWHLNRDREGEQEFFDTEREVREGEHFMQMATEYSTREIKNIKNEYRDLRELLFSKSLSITKLERWVQKSKQ